MEKVINFESDSDEVDTSLLAGDIASMSGTGSRILELGGLQAALLQCGGSIEFREELHNRDGLVTRPYLFCMKCSSKTPI